MTIGLAGTAVAVLVALLIGMAAGYFGGKADLIIQRFVDAWMAFPSLLILITVMSLLGRGAAQIIFALGISWGISSSRIVRGAILGIKENAYFQAARAVGAPATRTLIRHVLPNIAAPLIVIYTTTIGGVMLTEAALGFLGFGLPPDVASWGGMLSFEGRQYMQLAPRLAIWPGVALTTVVFGINVLGDALRDLLDPRLRGGSGRFNVTKRVRVPRQRRAGGGGRQ
jgi:peptide/nickel transport system permease protein